MEKHLPFTVEHHLRRPQAGRAAGHAQEDLVGSCPSTIEANHWARRNLSHLMPWWMVTPNSKPERSMATRFGEDSGDGGAGG
jgi:hypothetical protein